MRIHHEVHYPADPGQVAAMLADTDFLQQVSDRMGAVSSTEDVVGDPSGAFTATSVRTMSTKDLAEVWRKFVGQTLDVRQVDEWKPPGADGTRTGTLLVEIVGAPVRLTGTLALTPDGDGSTETIDGDLKVNVPLMGRTFEKAVEPAIQSGIRQQIKVAHAWFV